MKKILSLLIAVFFLFQITFQVNVAAEELSVKNKNMPDLKHVDEKLKILKKTSKYNEKIDNYKNIHSEGYIGEWCLCSNDTKRETLIIKKIGDIFYAEFFGFNHWKGVGYFFDGKLFISFKYTNEFDAGYATYELKKHNRMSYASINGDFSSRCHGEFIKVK